MGAHDDHGETQPADAVGVGEHRPGLVEEVADEFYHRELGDNEKQAAEGGEEEGDALEDKVRLVLVDLDDEDPAAGGRRRESNDCRNTKGLKNKVPNSMKGAEA